MRLFCFFCMKWAWFFLNKDWKYACEKCGHVRDTKPDGPANPTAIIKGIVER